MLRRDALKIMGGTVLLPSILLPSLSATKEKPLKLEMWHNGIDTVIAENIDEARLLVAKMYFGKNAEPFFPNPKQKDEWGFYIIYRLSNYFGPRFTSSLDNVIDEIKIIYYDDIDGDCGWDKLSQTDQFVLWEEYPGNCEVTKTVKKWIEEYGKGYFASTQY